MRLHIFVAFLLIGHNAIAQQQYPNISGKTLLDDDRVVVQYFKLDPGQWEGIHEHPEYQLVIVLNSSDELTYRTKGTETLIRQEVVEGSEDYNAFWRPGPVPMSDQHETGNTGTEPLEWIAITFKDNANVSEADTVQFLPLDE